MTLISDILFNVLIFLSVYVQMFFFITFLENRKKIIIRNHPIKLTKYPKVTVIVPCWNEEKTIYKTVRSLLDLNYPKDKINIFLIDDGSTDGTWDAVSKFSGYPNVKTFHKENGGKYTALNLGLENVKTDFVGCLDADSIVEAESLVRIMSYFERDKNTMAVAPSVTVLNPNNIIQEAQKAEYHMGVFTKKMLGFLGAIHVTPGPFTIFRKQVFDNLGPYRHGYSTEDMEIAYRMQKNDYKIEHCNDAYVYTKTPSSIRKLYRQRLRWIYGFINNTIDYRGVLFRKKYGNFALFTLPTGIISISAVSYLFGKMIYNLGHLIYSKIISVGTVGWSFSTSTNNLSWFSMDAHPSMFLIIFVYSLVIFAIVLGRKMVEGRWVLSLNMLYYLLLFRILAPLWLINAIYNTVISKKPAWR